MGGTHAVGLRTALVVGLAVAALAIIGLGLAEALDVGLLLRPGDRMDGNGAAALGVGLLVVDIVAPVPSSLVMLAHGAIFGVLPGAALSLVGRTGNAVVGVLLGRGAGAVLERRAGRRRRTGDDLLRRWGLAAVVATRPIPVVAESTVVAAGAVGMSVPAVAAAAAVGSVPEAVLFDLAAAVAWAVGARLEADADADRA